MYRVVLVDDDRLIIRGLTAILPWKELECEVAGTAMDGQEGLRLIRELKPDLVLTDIRMPNMDGLAMAAAVCSEFPDTQLSVLTAYRDFEYAREAIRLGVCRYLLKPSDLEELKEALSEMTARRARALEREGRESGEPAENQAAHGYVVEGALAWMREHCTEHISLQKAADHVYVSQWHLSKLINRETGLGFLELLSRMRVDKAKELLKNPANRIGDVAWQAGFADVAHFSRTFRKVSGQTPGEFRAALPGPGSGPAGG